MRPPGKKGLFAASALAKVMSGDMTTAMTLAVGDKAGYDPVNNVMILPGIPGDDISDEVRDKLLAYLGHEAAERGDSTWMPTDPRWAQKPDLMCLVNGINDARIDMLQSERYPGFGMKMRAIRTAQAHNIAAAYRKGLAPSFKAFATLCVTLGENIYTVDDLYSIFPKWRKFLNRAESILRNLDVSTEEKCIEQALALYDALKTPKQPESRPESQSADSEPQTGKSEPQDDSNDKDTNAKSKSTGKAESQGDEKAEAAEKDVVGPLPAEPQSDGDGGEEDGGEPATSEEPSQPEAPLQADDMGGRGHGGEGSVRDGDGGSSGTDEGGVPESNDAGEDGRGGNGSGNGDTGTASSDTPPPRVPNDAQAKGDGDHCDDGGRRAGAAATSASGNSQEPVDDGEQLTLGNEAVGDVQGNLLKEILSALFVGQDMGNNERSKFSHAASANQPKSYSYDPSRDVILHVKDVVKSPLQHAVYARAAQVLETKLRQVMTAPAMLHTRHRDRGELDERSIARFVAGDDNVFRRRIRQESDNVAACVSWDESGSMLQTGPLVRGLVGPPAIKVVRDLAYTWNEALGRLNIPTELLGWCGPLGGYVGNANVYRQSTIRHSIYKQFHENWRDQKVLARLNNITTVHNTPTAEGLMFAAERLGRRPESRRILFFLTDGEPSMAANGPAYIHTRFVKTVLKRCAQVGIEVIGVGIKKDISKLFPISIQVNDVQELQHTVSDELIKLLTAR